ncbi:MAG: hypothetical protein LCI02_13105 [Proteobacteria bacterium]|nr:hypothetical protein [Pseudomonadota bacterium]
MLRYLEEALAEGYGQLRVNGLLASFSGLRFPIVGGYMTVAELAGEGMAIGTITLGGTLFYVCIVQGLSDQPSSTSSKPSRSPVITRDGRAGPSSSRCP